MRQTIKIMKKFLLLLLSLTTLASGASASRKSRVYFGMDYLNTEAKHQYFDKYNQAIGSHPNRSDAASSASGFSFNLGFKSYLNRFYAAPEIFFDQLNSSTPDFYAPQPQNGNPLRFSQDELAVNYRYGARLNLGVNPYRNLNFFANIGIASVDYDVRWNNSNSSIYGNNSHGSQELTPIYGAGISYDINKHFTIKLSQDYQRIKAVYVFEGLVDQIDLMVTRAGVAYSF